jgi:threonine aldolase
MTTVIDLFSDTATLPTPAMLQVMVQAKLGDEQRALDPTVNALERRVAELLEKESAVLVPSATMANQIALSIHCPWGGEVICHRSAHVYNYEAGGLALNARAQVFPLDGEGGFFTGHDVRTARRSQHAHLPASRAVVIENTTNVEGGRVWPDADFDSVVEASRSLGLKLHLDGARLWNASVRRGVTPARWSREVDTVSVCFSKGLGCPFGAVLAGTSTDMAEARRLKQAMGGALRQSGIMAAAMLYALDHNVDRLSLDHERAARIGAKLMESASLEVRPVETNMVYFRPRGFDCDAFAERLERAGVLVCPVETWLRICTHLGVDDADCARAVELVLATASDLTV